MAQSGWGIIQTPELSVDPLVVALLNHVNKMYAVHLKRSFMASKTICFFFSLRFPWTFSFSSFEKDVISNEEMKTIYLAWSNGVRYFSDEVFTFNMITCDFFHV